MTIFLGFLFSIPAWLRQVARGQGHGQRDKVILIMLAAIGRLEHRVPSCQRDVHLTDLYSWEKFARTRRVRSYACMCRLCTMRLLRASRNLQLGQSGGISMQCWRQLCVAKSGPTLLVEAIMLSVGPIAGGMYMCICLARHLHGTRRLLSTGRHPHGAYHPSAH